MAKIYKFSNYAKTFNVKVITDGYADQKTFTIVDILGKNDTAIRAGFNLDIQPVTEFQLEQLATAKNFSLSVMEEGESTVTINTAENVAAEILTYEFTGVTEVSTVINSAAGTILIHVPNLTVVTALVANFTLSAGASVKIGATAQVSGTTANNFTSPKTYVVTSEHAEVKNFVVTVVVD